MYNIAFLLGAGVSIPAGMPDVKELTNEIFSNYKNWCISNTAGQRFQTIVSFKHPNNFKPEQDEIFTIANFLKIVGSLLEKHTDNLELNSYEDVYDILFQIHAHISKNYENPALQSLINELQKNNSKPIDFLCTQSLKFIEDVVRYKLQTNSRIGKLEPLLKIIKLYDEKEIHIFTLNYDTLIEDYLSKKVTFHDGFTHKLYKDQVRIFQIDSLLYIKQRVHLYKLHGSFDWEYILNGKYNNRLVKIVKPMENYPYFEFGGEERVYGRYTGLMGISNKLLNYNYGIFLEMLMLLHIQLKKCNPLIISGYSFSDYGVNLRIIDWMTRKRNAKIIFIDPFAENTINKARGAINTQIPIWRYENRFNVITCGFQDWDGNLDFYNI
ncbi:MAG: SIR2 family protein [FCB group bacterium]|jgi:hypothetical protein